MQQKANSFYRGKDCLEKFCKDVKELAVEISNYRKQEIIPLTDREIKFCERQKVCHTCKKFFGMMKIRKKNLDYTKKSGIIVITPQYLEELLIVFAI